MTMQQQPERSFWTDNDNKVQVVDLAPFRDGSNKQAVADSMLSAFKSTGFVYLVNHDLSPGDVQNMFNWSKRFFSLPTETKNMAPHPESGTHHRGYSPPGQEKIIQQDAHAIDDLKTRLNTQDFKESFESGREEDELMPNIWLPDGILPGFKEACLDFFWKCHQLEKTILRVLALGFHLPEDYFIQFHTKADNQLRLLHYPSYLHKPEQDQVVRITGHTDFDSFTILFQDEVGGLEAEHPNTPGHFIAVPPIPGSVVVNAGDFLMRWSNDIIKSTVHRVRAPSQIGGDGMVPDRYSIPYFCSADLSTIVDAIPGTWSAERPKRYEPISAGEYVMNRLAANY